MDAIPSRPPGQEEQISGLSCPECPGVLAVSAENGHLRFRCRIGHAYSLLDLIELKECRLEESLRAPTTTLDELATLLHEAVAAGIAPGSPQAFEERAQRALRHIEMLKHIIEENEPTALGPEGPR